MGLIDKMFDGFDTFLAEQGFEAKGGAIIDATIVEVPKQRNTRDENKQIKSGKTPKAFKPALPENCNEELEVNS